MPQAPPRLPPMRPSSHRRALHGPAVLLGVQTRVPTGVVLPPEGEGRRVTWPMPRKCIRCVAPAIPGTSRCPYHDRRSSRWARYRSDSRYRTAAWTERRKRQLAENPDCAICGQPASVADHVTAVKLGGDWDGPLQSLCASCSHKKSSSEGGKARKLKYGPRPRPGVA